MTTFRLIEMLATFSVTQLLGDLTVRPNTDSYFRIFNLLCFSKHFHFFVNGQIVIR